MNKQITSSIFPVGTQPFIRHTEPNITFLSLTSSFSLDITQIYPNCHMELNATYGRKFKKKTKTYLWEEVAIELWGLMSSKAGI